MLRGRFVNRYMIGFAVIVLLIAGFMGIGSVVMEGENPVSMGVTIWFLNASGRDILRVANETDRYVMVYDQGWQERLSQSLSTIEGITGSWSLDYDDGQTLGFVQEAGEKQNEEKVTYQYYKDEYVIVTYGSSSSALPEN